MIENTFFTIFERIALFFFRFFFSGGTETSRFFYFLFWFLFFFLAFEAHHEGNTWFFDTVQTFILTVFCISKHNFFFSYLFLIFCCKNICKVISLSFSFARQNFCIWVLVHVLISFLANIDRFMIFITNDIEIESDSFSFFCVVRLSFDKWYFFCPNTISYQIKLKIDFRQQIIANDWDASNNCLFWFFFSLLYFVFRWCWFDFCFTTYFEPSTSDR